MFWESQEAHNNDIFSNSIRHCICDVKYILTIYICYKQERVFAIVIYFDP